MNTDTTHVGEWLYGLLGVNENDSLDVFGSSHASMENLPTTPIDLFANALWYIAVLLLALGVVVSLYKLIPRNLRMSFWKYLERGWLAGFFTIVWLAGFAVYCVGGYSNGFGFLSVAFMSIIHATEMFVGGSDISAVHEVQHENAFYMFTFGLVHILALMCSLVFIIRLIGFFFVSGIKAWFVSFVSFKKNDTYVFWGINEASLLLADSIVKHYGRKGGYRILFVRTNDNSERDSEGFTPSNILSKLRIRRDELLRLQELNCTVVSGNQKLSMLTIDNEEDVLRECLDLSSLRRIIKWKSENTHIFVLGENENDNIKVTLNLLCDVTIKRAKTDIYCHCRRSAKTRSLEYYGLTHSKERSEVHVIDTSLLSVDQLKLDERLQPVRHVAVNPDATIDTPFNALIVGFGETGTEALRFLYEFAAFVGKDKKKSPFHCTIFDSNMQERRGVFAMQNPFVEQCSEIEFLGHSIDSPDYWRIIKDRLIHDLNYIVVCPGSDGLALETASNLCSLALRYRTDRSPEKLTICVRSYNPDNERRLVDFCNDINEKYKAYGIEVEPFGLKDKLFTYDFIVNDTILQQAMKFNCRYEGKPEGTEKNVWEDSLGYKKEGTYSIDEIEDIERRREQNFSNALHCTTKLYILDQCCSRDDIPDNIKENMARLEHERWVASNYMRGWQRMAEPTVGADGKIKTRLTTRKLHTDLCPWEDIRKWDKEEQKKTQENDYKVLTTTLKLQQKEQIIMETDKKNYTPQPIDTSGVTLPEELNELAEYIAKNVHEVWAYGRMKDGWTYGSERDDEEKKHPCLVPYEELSDSEKDYDRNTSQETLKLIVKLGYRIEKEITCSNESSQSTNDETDTLI